MATDWPFGSLCALLIWGALVVFMACVLGVKDQLEEYDLNKLVDNLTR